VLFFFIPFVESPKWTALSSEMGYDVVEPVKEIDMKRRDWVAGVCLLLGLAAIAYVMLPPSPVMLRDLDAAKTSIEANGFRCASDRADGLPSTGFLVSRDELPWYTANGLCKAGLIGPNWKGKVWVCKHIEELPGITPENAIVFHWGGVVAFGDREVLSEIERSLRRNSRSGV
jgi:hypothetical protein